MILRNAGTGSLTIASNVSSTGPMALDLGDAANNVVLIDNSGAITISATMTGAGTVAIGADTSVTALTGSAGALDLVVGNTLTVNQATSGTAAMPFTGSP